MATYHIKGPFSSETRKRVDAAQAVLDLMTYEAVEAFAGLDTRWGHDAVKQAEQMNWSKGGCVSTSQFTIFCTKSKV